MNLRILYSLILSTGFLACSQSSDTPAKRPEETTTPTRFEKAGSSFSDTLKISTAGAVFYSPDSLQLEKIKSGTDPQIFDGLQHENFYLMRNAHIVLRREYPNLKIIDSKHARYLLFMHSDTTSEIVDLDNKKDPWGLFIFDAKKPPLLVDMANIETEPRFYFQAKQ